MRPLMRAPGRRETRPIAAVEVRYRGWSYRV